MNMLNVIAALVCVVVSANAVGERRYVSATIGAVIAIANMWMAVNGG